MTESSSVSVIRFQVMKPLHFSSIKMDTLLESKLKYEIKKLKTFNSHVFQMTKWFFFRLSFPTKKYLTQPIHSVTTWYLCSRTKRLMEKNALFSLHISFHQASYSKTLKYLNPNLFASSSLRNNLHYRPFPSRIPSPRNWFRYLVPKRRVPT
jgi:hypothetical protein